MTIRPYAAETPESLFTLNRNSVGQLVTFLLNPTGTNGSSFQVDDVSSSSSTTTCSSSTTTTTTTSSSSISTSSLLPLMFRYIFGPCWMSESLPTIFEAVISLPDDVLYETSLIANIFFAIFLRYIPTTYDLRAWYSSVIGLLNVVIFCGPDLYHMMFLICGVWLLCRFYHHSAYCGYFVFFHTFSYVGAIRFLDSYGFINLRSTANMCMLLTSLRLVSVGFHVQDQNTTTANNTTTLLSSSPYRNHTTDHDKEKDDDDDDDEDDDDYHHHDDNTTTGATNKGNPCLFPCSYLKLPFLEMCHYIFFFLGLWAGPFISYETVMHTLRNPSTYTSHVLGPCIYTMLSCSFHVLAFFAIPFFFQHDTLFSPTFQTDYGKWGGVVIISLVIAQRRARFVVAWMAAEISCLLGGTGYDPTLPGDQEMERQSEKEGYITSSTTPGQHHDDLLFKNNEQVFFFHKSPTSNRSSNTLLLLDRMDTTSSSSDITLTSSCSSSEKPIHGMLSSSAAAPAGAAAAAAAAAAADLAFPPHSSPVVWAWNRFRLAKVCSFTGRKVNPLVTRCTSPWHVEFYTSIKQLGRNWNCSVQSWLVMYVYKRCSGIRSVLLRKQIVMCVSAFWHGLDAGYYGMFLILGFCQAVQEPVWNLPWPYEKQPYVAKFYSLIKWLASFLMLQSATVPFVFTKPSEFLHVWRIQGYYGFYVFVLLLSIYIISGLFSPRDSKGGSEGVSEKKAVLLDSEEVAGEKLDMKKLVGTSPRWYSGELLQRGRSVGEDEKTMLSARCASSFPPSNMTSTNNKAGLSRN